MGRAPAWPHSRIDGTVRTWKGGDAGGLYRDLDLDLLVRGAAPRAERTKHVHRLHPYLGKFIPQLVEALLDRYVREGGHVLDPFAGSGTTLVQALESGYDATGIDIAAFNVLLMEVKTADFDPASCGRISSSHTTRPSGSSPRGSYPASASPYVRAWYAATAAEELLAFQRPRRGRRVSRRRSDRACPGGQVGAPDDALRPRSPSPSAGRGVLVPQAPTPLPAGGVGAPVPAALRLDTLERIEAFAAVRAADCAAVVVHGDARLLPLAGRYDGVVTSPPYPGLIDYHEQHRYAYGCWASRRAATSSRPPWPRHVATSVGGVRRRRRDGLRNCADALRPGAPVCIVVNDRRDLYPTVLARAGLRLVERHERHVNRRTGRRAGEYF